MVQLDVEGLNITVKSAPATTPGKGKARGKGKAKAEGTEILCDAKLRLQAGQRYALLGRNGSGKSSRLAPAHAHHEDPLGLHARWQL